MVKKQSIKWIYSILKKAINQRKWLVFTFMTIFITVIFGIVGYRYSHLNYLDSFYSTIRLYTFSVDIKTGTKINIFLEIARWLAAFTVVANIIKTILYIFRQRIQLLKLSFQGGHYLIYGLNEYSKHLAIDLISQGFKVVMIDDNKDNPLLNDACNHGCIVLIDDSFSMDVLRTAGLARCTHFIIFTANDVMNIEIVINAEEVIRQDHQKSQPPVKIYVRILDNMYESVLDELAKQYQSGIDLRLFNNYENSAKLLFERFPLYSHLDINNEHEKAAHLLIVGFGHTGRNVLLQAAKIGHFPNRKTTKITVIDKDANSKEISFRMNYPEIFQVCDIIFKQFDVKEKAFFNYISTLKDPITYIAVCFDNQELDFTSAAFLIKNFKDIKIAVRMSRGAIFANWLDNNRNVYENIIRFGAVEEVSSADVIIGESIEKVAKQIHNSYLEKTHATTEWENLDRFTKSSNLSQIEHIPTKLYAVGLYMKSKKDLVADDQFLINEDEYLKWINDYVEDLAITEHARWNAFHFMNGFKKQSPFLEKNKDLTNKTHGCLVSWEELDYVSQVRSNIEKMKIDYKFYDRQYVTSLFSILDQAGYCICKLKRKQLGLNNALETSTEEKEFSTL
ncbi:NAD-binding protein [Gottfriedia acidiceleris]|uniref:NAD-binding protein n=1 Tax=Gottfriedia acidiceleris TaxID=371036 RepID=UPI002FFD9765